MPEKFESRLRSLYKIISDQSDSWEEFCDSIYFAGFRDGEKSKSLEIEGIKMAIAELEAQNKSLLEQLNALLDGVTEF